MIFGGCAGADLPPVAGISRNSAGLLIRFQKVMKVITGVLLIAKPDFNGIKAEYIAGNISLKALSEKYGVCWTTLRTRSAAEQWGKAREKARIEAVQTTCRKSAEKAADNATLAADIKRKGLQVLSRLFDEFDLKGTERRETKGAIVDVKRLRDLTAAYKDLCGDIAPADKDDNALLKSLYEMERGLKRD